MHCRKITGWMSEYIDGCLDARKAHLLEQHLAGCESCRRELAQLREAVSILHSVEPVQPPRDLADQVSRFIREERTAGARLKETGQFGLWFHSVPVRAAVAAGFVLALVFLVGRNPPQKEETSAARFDEKEAPVADLDRIQATASEPAPLPVPTPAPADVPREDKRQAMFRDEQSGGRAGRGEKSTAGGAAHPRALGSVAASAAPVAVAEERAEKSASQRAGVDTIIAAMKKTANWVRPEDHLGLERKAGTLQAAAGPSSQILLRAEVPAASYEAFEEELSTHRGVFIRERSATNGVVRVLIAIEK
jgi:hypothetical protein